MSVLRTLAAAVVAVAAMTMCATPVLANPGNGNGNGNSGNHGNSGNKGNSGHSQKGHADQKNNAQSEQRKIMVSRTMLIVTSAITWRAVCRQIRSNGL